jgi:hypothetical protein
MQAFALVLVAVGVLNLWFRITGDAGWFRVVAGVGQVILFLVLFGLTVQSRRQNRLGR